MKSPTQKSPKHTQSWLLWNLAFTLAASTKPEVDSYLGKRSAEEQTELLHRVNVIRRTKAIPVGEFL